MASLSSVSSPSSSMTRVQSFIDNIETILNNNDMFFKFTRHLISSLILSNNYTIEEKQPIYRQSKFRYFGMNVYDTVYPSDENSDLIIKMLQSIIDSLYNVDNEILPDEMIDNAIYEHTIDIIDKMLSNIDIRNDKLKPKFDKFKNILRLLLTVDKESLLGLSSMKNLSKPQSRFDKTLDNSYEHPFKPTLTDKPFAQKALKIEECPITIVDPNVLAPTTYYSHPYDIELRRLMYPEWQLADPNLNEITDPVDLSYEYIDTIESLQMVLVDIQESKEIAVAVQNHSYRSFQGFICILQIATRDKVYIIDAIALRSKICLLAPVFANPFIVKVFHGCEKVITWLQRDFNLYVINCFDTQNAAKLLKYPDTSLGHILQYLGGISLNKNHLMLDWRQRPLPLELIRFAKSDVNYLLFLYDNLRRVLWSVHSREGLEAVLNASRKSCLKRYEKELFWPLGYRKLLDIPRSWAPKAQDISDEQDTVMAALWQWRDNIARNLDESVHFILSNSELLRIGLMMPTTASEFQQCQPVRNDDSFRDIIIELVVSSIRRKPKSELTSIPKSPTSNLSHQAKETSHDYTPSKFNSPTTERNVNVNENTKRIPLADRLLCGRALRTPSREIVEAGPGLYSGNTNFSHVDTFTPLGSSYTNKHSESSPVMPADEIFRLAGWSTPGPLDNCIARSAGASPFLEENLDLMKRKETIPSSFEEIYAISNLNRKRNKDKRKVKDDDDDSESIDTTRASTTRETSRAETNFNLDGDMGSSLFDENIYFSIYKDHPDSTVDETLNFASSIGWIKSDEERQCIIENFEADCSIAEG